MERAAAVSRLFDFGVVLFLGEVQKREELEIMPTDSFIQSIVEAKASAKERGLKEHKWSSKAFPAIMACATYRLAGSPEVRRTVILFEILEVNSPKGDGSETDTNMAYLKLVQTFISMPPGTSL